MRPLGRRPRLAMLPPDMARGRPWTKAEDRELRQAAKSNRNYGILTHETKRTDPRPFRSREVPRGPAPPRRALGPHLRRRPQARLPARDSELPDRRLDLEIARMSQGGVRRRPQENTCDIRLLALRESAPAARSGVSPANPPIAQECDSNRCVVRHSDCLREVEFL